MDCRSRIAAGAKSGACSHLRGRWRGGMRDREGMRDRQGMRDRARVAAALAGDSPRGKLDRSAGEGRPPSKGCGRAN